MPTVEEAQVVEYIDDMLFHLEFQERFLIRSLLALLEIQPLLFNGTRPRLFTQATPEERTRNLAGWETSRIFQRRLVFMAIRTMLLWAYVDSTEVERGMGFVAGTKRTAERNKERQATARSVINMARGKSQSGQPGAPPEPNTPLQKPHELDPHLGGAVKERA